MNEQPAPEWAPTPDAAPVSMAPPPPPPDPSAPPMGMPTAMPGFAPPADPAAALDVAAPLPPAQSFSAPAPVAPAAPVGAGYPMSQAMPAGYDDPALAQAMPSYAPPAPGSPLPVGAPTHPSPTDLVEQQVADAAFSDADIELAAAATAAGAESSAVWWWPGIALVVAMFSLTWQLLSFYAREILPRLEVDPAFTATNFDTFVGAVPLIGSSTGPLVGLVAAAAALGLLYAGYRKGVREPALQIVVGVIAGVSILSGTLLAKLVL